MTVKELIEYLEKCNPEYDVQDGDGYSIHYISQITDMVNAENCRVELT